MPQFRQAKRRDSRFQPKHWSGRLANRPKAPIQPCTVESCERPGVSGISRYGRRLCKFHYLRMWTYGSLDLPDRPPQPWRTCTIPECGRLARTRNGKICEVHYYRARRTGSFERRPLKPRHDHSAGYFTVLLPNHPLAGTNGQVFEHRFLHWHETGPDPRPCVWCGTEVEWGGKGRRRLVVDHVNANKRDNSPENLVSSCQKCNSERAAVLAWTVCVDLRFTVGDLRSMLLMKPACPFNRERSAG